MKRQDIIASIFWLVLSVIAMLISQTYGLGTLRSPGPGFSPFVFAALLCIVSCCFLSYLLFRKYRTATVKKERIQNSVWKLAVTLGALYAYGFALRPVGYLISTFLVLTILSKPAGSKNWAGLLITSALATLVSYFLFTYLGEEFPSGFLFQGNN